MERRYATAKNVGASNLTGLTTAGKITIVGMEFFIMAPNIAHVSTVCREWITTVPGKSHDL